MTKLELAQVLVYLSAGVGKKLDALQARVYWDLLGDLPAVALQAAAKRALLEGQYPTIPPAGVLRRLAVEALSGQEYPPAAEAYRMALAVINGPSVRREAAVAALPEPVRRAADAIGWKSIGDSSNPETCRAQFTRVYEAYVARIERERLLPVPLKQALVRIGAGGVDGQVAGLLENLADTLAVHSKKKETWTP